MYVFLMAHSSFRLNCGALLSLVLLLLLSFQDVLVRAHHEELFLFHYGIGKKVLLVKSSSENEPCRIYGHNFPIEAIETSPNGPLIQAVDQAEWAKELAECSDRVEESLSYSPAQGILPQQQELSITSKQFDFIYPGTKWCGPGNIAQHYDELGTRYVTDRCCRDHDFCFDTMPSGTCKYGLCNKSPFSKSHCDCDEKFRECLMASTDPAGFAVGFLYFDIAAVNCFKQNGTQCRPFNVTSSERNFRRETNKPSGWCFEPPLPFKKPIVTLQQERKKSLSLSREDSAEQDIPSIFHRVLLSVSNVKSVVKKTVTAAWMDHQQTKG